METLLQFTGKSIYCARAGVHIDPWTPVDRAIITHAHSDHARPGCRHYLAHQDSAAILRLRLGEDISLQTVRYNEAFSINGVTFSLHPAGHIIGSAQVRVAYGGEVWVVSGDYKTEQDGVAAAFEPVPCHRFITECTFGLPVYHWQPQQQVFEEINDWRDRNTAQGITSVLMGYALGKMQRLLHHCARPGEELWAHGAVYNVQERLRAAGVSLPPVKLLTRDISREQLKGRTVLAPPSANGSAWIRRFGNYATGYCSGWMALRGAKNRRAVDRGFVLSDHADWQGLNTAVKATGAEKVYATHGYTSIFSRWLQEQGIAAAEVQTMYGAEEEEQQADNPDGTEAGVVS